jgi:N-acetylmuramoyl-L-alanine amidase
MQYKQTFPTPQEHSAGKNTCKYIVLHHTGTKEGTIQGVLSGLNKRADFASCHYCVDVNGDIYKMGNDTDILWHAGVSSWKGLTDLNNHSIGIETIGPMSNGGFTDAQRKAVAEIIVELCNSHNIGIENILRHKDIAPLRKVDIADTFWNVASPSWEDWKKTIFTPKDPVASWAEPSFKKAEKKKGFSRDRPTEPVDPVRLRKILVKAGYKITDNNTPVTYQELIVVLDREGKFN